MRQKIELIIPEEIRIAKVCYSYHRQKMNDYKAQIDKWEKGESRK